MKLCDLDYRKLDENAVNWLLKNGYIELITENDGSKKWVIYYGYENKKYGSDLPDEIIKLLEE